MLGKTTTSKITNHREEMTRKTATQRLSVLAIAAAFASCFTLPRIASGAETRYFPVASSRVGP